MEVLGALGFALMCVVPGAIIGWTIGVRLRGASYQLIAVALFLWTVIVPCLCILIGWAMVSTVPRGEGAWVVLLLAAAWAVGNTPVGFAAILIESRR
jgi:hypothetical protein